MRIIALVTIGIVGAIGIAVCSLSPFSRSGIRTVSTPRGLSQNSQITIAPDRGGHDQTNDVLDAGPDTVDCSDVIEPAATQSATPAATQSGTQKNLRYKVDLLERGMKSLQEIAAYTAVFQKQEVVQGELLPEQTITMKCRHKPFSVYMNWQSGETGRELIYVDGKNNGKLIAHDGGWKSRIPALSLPPDGMLAMRDTRHPVTTAGLLGLANIMLGIHRLDLLRSTVAVCEVDANQTFDGRACLQFTTTYKSRTDSPIYRKSITLIDREWNVPLHSRHFEWPKSETPMPEAELDDATLLESYSFTDVHLQCRLSDHDFDRSNSEYNFH